MKGEEAARETINSQLEDEGWEETTDINNGTGYYQEYPTDSGPVDYALLIRGIPIAIIEAKKPSVNVKSIFEQAERYAKSLPTDTQYSCSPGNEKYGIPIAFGANGKEIYQYEFRINSRPNRKIPRFPTKNDLQKQVSINYEKAFDQINTQGLIEKIDPKLWKHQNEAAHAVFESWGKSRQKALTHLATGTGKTRMAMAISWAFLESGLGRKILFIPNQRQLANEAYQSFKTYEPARRDFRMGDQYRIHNLEEDDAYKNADIVITTLQKVWSLSKENNPFSLNEFDLIITDESHKSIYNDEGYGHAIDQLDAYHLGLTATPTKRTLKWFNNNDVYHYTYEQGVEDDNLVPFTVQQIETKLTMNGIEVDGKTYKSQDIGKTLQIPETNIEIGQAVRDHIEIDMGRNIDDELILVFACNDRHAIEIAEDWRQNVFPDKPDSFVQRATYSADRPHDNIDQFSSKYKNPKVLITVQMVEEGVDIPELEHIVLMKPVHSPVMYNQMMGRGTRASGGKEFFTIYDALGVVDHFNEKGYGPFNTFDFDGATQVTGSAGTPTKKSEHEYIELDIEDHLLRNESVFQLENGKQQKKEQYKKQVEGFVKANEPRIEQLRDNAQTIDQFNKKLRTFFLEQDRSYSPPILAKAFGLNEEHSTYADIIDSIFYNTNLSTTRTEQVIETLQPHIKNSEWGEAFTKFLHEAQRKSLKESDFYNEPFSSIGASKIENDILKISLTEFITKYNQLHLKISKRNL